ncbi:MAG: rod shape-determining protein MreC [Woeseiaceae bacterium]|nr:rod shape-determining protein MreC [Woeseiaceae bacterium]
MASQSSSNANAVRIPALGLRVAALMLLSILLMVYDDRNQQLDTVRRAIGAAVYPLQIVVDTPARIWGWLVDSSTSRNSLELENTRLKIQQRLTRAELQQLTALEAENARLRDLLEARDRITGDIRVAGIMSVDTNPFRHSIVLDVGSEDRVYDGQSLIDANGVVGQVLQTGLKTSQAILISDPDHALPVEVNRNGLRTIALGTGQFDQLDLPYLPNNADLEVGDVLVTSGLGGAFPPGYPVAVVSDIRRVPQQPFAEVKATPSAALNQVREVMLIWMDQPEASSNEATTDGEVVEQP